ncbi:serine protease 27-like [Menidia menidia]
MALHQIVHLAVLITLSGRGCHFQQPACGKSVINSRINGGENAPPGRWPWLATIRYENQFTCVGSLINDQWVLTSAQCSFMGYISGSEVHLGAHSKSDFNPNGVVRKVASISCHSEFNLRTKDNDICLLKLSAPVNFTDYVQPVCLASENSTFHDGVTSWVTSIDSNNYFSGRLVIKEAMFPVAGNNRCNCSLSSFYGPMSENMMCAGVEDGTNTTCWGDVGAPLVTLKGSVWVQSGIAGRQYGCYFPWRFSVFTRVSQYQKWIAERVTGVEPGFVSFISPGSDRDLNFTCPAPTTTTTTTTTTTPTTTRFFPYSTPVITTEDQDGSIFGSGENLIHSALHFYVLTLVVLSQLFGT